MIDLIIVDDHQMILKGLVSMLKSVKDLNILETFNDSKMFLEYLKSNDKHPQVIVLDINMPEINGLEVCKIINKEYPEIQVLALTNYNESSFAKNMMRNGAKGYMIKNCTKEDLITGIKAVFNGEIYISKKIQDQLLQENFGVKKNTYFMPKLSNREKEVLLAISKEMTNSEIGDLLFISVKTVESHRTNLLRKFSVKNTAGLIKFAYVKGYLS